MFQPQPTAYAPFSSYGVGSPVVDFPGYHSASGARRVPIPVAIPVVVPGPVAESGVGDVVGNVASTASAGPGSQSRGRSRSQAIFRDPVFSPVNANANNGNGHGNGNAIPNGRTLNFNQQHHHPAVRLFKMEGHINDMEEQQRLAAEYEAQLEVWLCDSKMRALC